MSDEILTGLLIEDLRWSYENTASKKVRKALQIVMAYYMTYPECCEYFGKKKANKLWRETDV